MTIRKNGSCFQGDCDVGERGQIKFSKDTNAKSADTPSLLLFGDFSG